MNVVRENVYLTSVASHQCFKGLVLIQTVLHSENILERFFLKMFLKQMADDKTLAK